MASPISSIPTQLAAFAGKAHAAVKSHLITVAYLVIVAAIVIPLGAHIIGYWKPLVESWVPAGQPKMVRR